MWYDVSKSYHKEVQKYGTGKYKIEHIFGGGYTALEVWKKAWSKETHETEYAQKRIKSAKSAKMTPIKIDTTDLYGYFQGSHGRYETFLDSCPCGDFIRNKLPCKHIYRLAMELGLLNEKAESNTNAIPTPKRERVSLDEEIDIVEGLSENAQYTLKDIASSINSANPTYTIRLDSIVEELINSGIIVDTQEEHLINFGKKPEIIELLEKENIPYKKSDKVSVLKQICTDNIPEKAKEKFGEIVSISIPTIYSPQQIHYYLHRKFDCESFYDENMVLQEVRLLETELPIDSITDQLIKRGYYIKK